MPGLDFQLIAWLSRQDPNKACIDSKKTRLSWTELHEERRNENDADCYYNHLFTTCPFLFVPLNASTAMLWTLEPFYGVCLSVMICDMERFPPFSMSALDSYLIVFVRAGGNVGVR